MTDGVVRRPALEADLPFLLALRDSTMGPHHRVAGIEQSADEALARVRADFDSAEIVELDGRPIGLVKLRRGSGAWRLLQLQLAPPWQGRGIGTRIVKTTIAQAQQAGAGLELGVLAVNPARRLYERLGFVVVGTDDAGLHMRHVPWRLRAADPGDALCLGVLATQVFLDTDAHAGIRPDIAREVLAECSPAVYAGHLADPALSIAVADRAGHLIAFAEWAPARECPLPTLGTGTQLRRLYVQPAQHRQGLGAALLRHVDADRRRRGEPLLWLTAWVGNRNALDFYAAQGLRDRGRTEYRFEDQVFENRVLVTTDA